MHRLLWAGLTRHLRAEGVQVVEVNQPDKTTRRRRGKTDAVDAEAAARAVLCGRATATAKTGDGPVEMARMFKLARTPRSSPAPRPSISSRPSWCPPTQPCASRCLD
jgi:transposase